MKYITDWGWWRYRAKQAIVQGQLKIRDKKILKDTCEKFIVPRCIWDSWVQTFFIWMKNSNSPWLSFWAQKNGWQWCCWKCVVADIMLATVSRCWWQNHYYVGNFFHGDFLNLKFGRFNHTFVTNKNCLQHPSPTSMWLKKLLRRSWDMFSLGCRLTLLVQKRLQIVKLTMSILYYLYNIVYII